MKKILIIEDDSVVQKMYEKFLNDNLPGNLIHFCKFLKDGIKAIKDFNGFDLYVLDGTVMGGHTSSIIDTLPKEKVIVICGEYEYVKECESKGIKSFMKPFTWTRLKENLPILTEILSK